MIKVIHQETLDAMRSFPSACADLVYMDPPFFTGRQFVSRSGASAFSDKWGGDLDKYIDAIFQRIVAAFELLKPHGSIVVHVDPTVSHYLKVAIDSVFGRDHFASEIIWRYRRWPAKTPNFQRVHDVLLRYVRDPSATPRWVQEYEPLAPSTVKAWGTKKQRAQLVEGKRVRSIATEQESPGVPMGDVWEIGILAPVSKERTGYPTQKPEALLERLISALTLPGDMVIDPFAGSGTTLAVAHRMGRSAIGIDASEAAISTMRDRLGDFAEFDSKDAA